MTQSTLLSSLNAPSKKRRATFSATTVSGIDSGHGPRVLVDLWGSDCNIGTLRLGCRSFVIQQIPSSNLFMVVVDNKCDCSSIPPVTMDPIEIMYILSGFKTEWFKLLLRNFLWEVVKCVYFARFSLSCLWMSLLDCFEHNESLKCDRLKFQKDRKKPESCHPFHPEVWKAHSLNVPVPVPSLCDASALARLHGGSR